LGKDRGGEGNYTRGGGGVEALEKCLHDLMRVKEEKRLKCGERKEGSKRISLEEVSEVDRMERAEDLKRRGGKKGKSLEGKQRKEPILQFLFEKST